MDIQVASDLHLEFFTDKTERKNDWASIICPSAPVLVLAGDICQATSPPKLARLTRFLMWCSKQFKAVLYVPGNHEFYNIDNPKYMHRMCPIDEALKSIEAICERLGNVHLLYRKSIVIDNVCFIGATLWTAVPTPAAAQTMLDQMNDFTQIYTTDKEQLTPAAYNSMHIADRAFIERQLIDTPPDLKKVVITHHAPSYLGTCRLDREAVPDFDTNRNLQACTYASALGDLVVQSDAWIFGHTHFCVDKMRGSCRLVANQRGYVTGNGTHSGSYNPNFSFKV